MLGLGGGPKIENPIIAEVPLPVAAPVQTPVVHSLLRVSRCKWGLVATVAAVAMAAIAFLSHPIATPQPLSALPEPYPPLSPVAEAYEPYQRPSEILVYPKTLELNGIEHDVNKTCMDFLTRQDIFWLNNGGYRSAFIPTNDILEVTARTARAFEKYGTSFLEVGPDFICKYKLAQDGFNKLMDSLNGKKVSRYGGQSQVEAFVSFPIGHYYDYNNLAVLAFRSQVLVRNKAKEFDFESLCREIITSSPNYTYDGNEKVLPSIALEEIYTIKATTNYQHFLSCCAYLDNKAFNRLNYDAQSIEGVEINNYRKDHVSFNTKLYFYRREIEKKDLWI